MKIAELMSLTYPGNNVGPTKLLVYKIPDVTVFETR